MQDLERRKNCNVVGECDSKNEFWNTVFIIRIKDLRKFSLN